jgi:HD-GYP domain-containing protein (c-di-GMP phosphodiesterase class II)
LLNRIKFVAEAYALARFVTLSVIAVGVASYALGHVGLATSPVILVPLMVGIGIALVIRVQRAVSRLRRQSKSARHSAARAEKHYIEVLRRIIKVVEGRDRYWGGHSHNVGRLSGIIARQLGLSDSLCEQMILAGELHDIGRLAVPESVILNHSRFGVEDFRSVQAHSAVSHDVLKPLEMLAEILPAIRSHHEKPNGTGYPDGLKKDDIPLGAHILSVADAYDAMTHDRPHRQAMSPVTAMRELRRCTPAGFDPSCVEALATAMNIPALEDVYNESPACEPCPA